jgi:hypothetical protein
MVPAPFALAAILTGIDMSCPLRYNGRVEQRRSNHEHSSVRVHRQSVPLTDG